MLNSLKLMDQNWNRCFQWSKAVGVFYIETEWMPVTPTHSKDYQSLLSFYSCNISAAKRVIYHDNMSSSDTTQTTVTPPTSIHSPPYDMSMSSALSLSMCQNIWLLLTLFPVSYSLHQQADVINASLALGTLPGAFRLENSAQEQNCRLLLQRNCAGFFP